MLVSIEPGYKWIFLFALQTLTLTNYWSVIMWVSVTPMLDKLSDRFSADSHLFDSNEGIMASAERQHGWDTHFYTSQNDWVRVDCLTTIILNCENPDEGATLEGCLWWSVPSWWSLEGMSTWQSPRSCSSPLRWHLEEEEGVSRRPRARKKLMRCLAPRFHPARVGEAQFLKKENKSSKKLCICKIVFISILVLYFFQT